MRKLVHPASGGEAARPGRQPASLRREEEAALAIPAPLTPSNSTDEPRGTPAQDGPKTHRIRRNNTSSVVLNDSV